jgi:hypothetical protein
MPQATLEAFADHGNAANAIDLDAHDADGVLRDAAAADVDLPAITRDLEREGVQAFCDSYRELLTCIDAKLADVATPVEKRRRLHDGHHADAATTSRRVRRDRGLRRDP